MKKKTINVGGKKLVIKAYETSFAEQEDRTVEEFNRMLEAEERHDEKLDTIAEEIASKAHLAVKSEEAVRFWEVGDLINRYLREIDSRSEGPAHYETKTRMLERVNQILEEKLRGRRDVHSDAYSVAYMRKWLRLPKIITKEQVQRPIPYWFYHELLYKHLTSEEIDKFLDRFEGGEITTTDQIREEVKALREGRSKRETSPQVEGSGSEG